MVSHGGLEVMQMIGVVERTPTDRGHLMYGESAVHGEVLPDEDAL
jgi:hypothetical protein